MSQIDVIKEVVEYEQLLRESNLTHILKGEYLIRDSYPDVLKILGVDAVATITNKEILNDKVIVEGKLDYNIIYLTRGEVEETKVESVLVSEKFNNYLDLNGGEHRVLCDIECGIEHIEATIINERKVAIDGILNLNWQIYKREEVEYVKEVQGSYDIQMLREDDYINRVKESKSVDLLGKSIMKVTMDKPEIDKIIKCNLKVNKKEIKLAEDKVYIGCYCNIELLYRGKDTKEVYKLDDNVYLSKEEEMIGINNEMLNTMNIDITSSDVNITMDDLGEARVANVEFIIKGKVRVYAKERISMIKDAYSINSNLELKKVKNEVGVVQGTNSNEIIVKDNIPLDFENENINQILSSNANILITDKGIENGRIKIEGVARVSVLFRKDNEEDYLGMCKGEIPFNTFMDGNNIKDDMEAVIKGNVENVDAVMEGNTIAVRINIILTSKICYKDIKDWIVDIAENGDEIEEKKSSVIIYVLGAEDNLWSLAKKYKCTMDELIKLNEIESADEVKQGKKMIVPGKCKF